jgi:short-subunit dehydrogenase involved in D-alanine esterification of teichoic acids
MPDCKFRFSTHQPSHSSPGEDPRCVRYQVPSVVMTICLLKQYQRFRQKCCIREFPSFHFFTSSPQFSPPLATDNLTDIDFDMGFQYKKVLVIGATSGIGRALAERFINEGSYVIAVGRRKDKLAELVQEHGHDKVYAVPFDITKMTAISAFATNIIDIHDDLDCIILNSGIQRHIDFSKPDEVDMDVVNEEFVTNYLSQLAITKAFLPFLMKKPTETALVYMTSGLSLVPITRCMNYCATKAALHQFILSLRVQLLETKIKVIEIFPPAVQTELHDAKHQPDIKDGNKMGMPLDEFTEETYQALAGGYEQIPIGRSKSSFQAFEMKRQEVFSEAVKGMSGGKIDWKPQGTVPQ